MSATLPVPIQTLAAMLLRLIAAVDGPSMFGSFPRKLAQLIMARLMTIRRTVRRLAEAIQAGTYRPRRSAGTRRKSAPRPFRPDPLPRQTGWLYRMLPGMAPFAGHLHQVLNDPATPALVAAAPGQMRRPLRALCRMLGVAPPPYLAIPRRPPPPPPPSPPAATAWPNPLDPPPAPPPDPPAPSWMPKRTRWTLTRIRGSPKPA